MAPASVQYAVAAATFAASKISPSLQTAALCEVMKILKGAGFDAKRPDRLDVAMCKDLPIKLVHASGSVRCKAVLSRVKRPEIGLLLYPVASIEATNVSHLGRKYTCAPGTRSYGISQPFLFATPVFGLSCHSRLAPGIFCVLCN